MEASKDGEDLCPFPKSTAKSVGVATALARSWSLDLGDFSSSNLVLRGSSRSNEGSAAIVAKAEGDGGYGDKNVPHGELSFASCKEGND